MQKIIYILIFITQILTANNNSFFHDLNQTMSDDFYKYGIKISTLNNYENNSTKLRIKNDFEKLLPNYLTSTKITSFYNFNKFQMLIAINRFFKVSSLYINLTKDQKLFEKNIKDLNNLVKNSKDFDSYVLSIHMYLRYYQNLNLTTNNFKTILQSNPPPPSKIFFEKYENEWNGAVNQILKASYDKEENIKDKIKVQKAFRKTLQYYLTHYKETYFTALRKKSSEEINKWYKNRKMEQKELLSFTTKIKVYISLFYASLKYKLFNIIDTDSYAIKVKCKQIALLMANIETHHKSTYLEHEKLLIIYNKLIKK